MATSTVRKKKRSTAGDDDRPVPYLVHLRAGDRKILQRLGKEYAKTPTPGHRSFYGKPSMSAAVRDLIRKEAIRRGWIPSSGAAA